MLKSGSIPKLPGYAINHPLPNSKNNAKSHILVYKHNRMLDVPVKGQEPEFPEEDVKALIESQSRADWRFTEDQLATSHSRTELSALEKTQASIPHVAPAWLSQDKQCLRFYCYTQVPIPMGDVNQRTRYCVLYHFLEDGTSQIVEPTIENVGAPQGIVVRRQIVKTEDGTPLGPQHLGIGMTLNVYGHAYRLYETDAFTTAYFEEHGLPMGEPEEPMRDMALTMKHEREEQAALPPRVDAVAAKSYNEKKTGAGFRGNAKLEQFLKNDRHVLRFYCYWDDKSVYGVRQYYILSYFLADDSVQISERRSANSGRVGFPRFFKRGPLPKKYLGSAYPGMLVPEEDRYMPKDFVCGQTINHYSRELFLYDCDEHTKQFYDLKYGVTQVPVEIPEVVMEKPLNAIPPFMGVGDEEDSLQSCYKLRPKQPKKDLEKVMTDSHTLRFEAEIANRVYEEDATRRFVLAIDVADDNLAVFEQKQANSGFLEGKFSEKSRKKNPATKTWYTATDFYVGNTITVAGQDFLLLRPDEFTMNYMEKRPEKFSCCDNAKISEKVKSLAAVSRWDTASTVEPDQLQPTLNDHEIITLMRKYGSEGSVGIPLAQVLGA